MWLKLAIILLPLFCYSQTGFMLVDKEVIPLDKQQHFAGGAFIALPTYTIARYELGMKRRNSILLAVGVSSLAGVIKEMSDNNKKNNKFDVVDLAYTSGGGLFMSLTLDLISKK